MDLSRQYLPTLSCEFFPPAEAEGIARLLEVRQRLLALELEYFSVTYGAGGSTQERTFQTVDALHRDGGVPVAPHLTCVGMSKERVRQILQRYRAQGIDRIVALSGDLPSGFYERGELRYASDLVTFIRQETGSYFHIEVGAYPEFHPRAKSAEQDMLHFKSKVEAGASGAVTQYFYNIDAYFRFIDHCEQLGIDIPIVPGIMPITNYQQLARFSDRCGAEIPRWIRLRLEGYGDDLKSLRAFGVEVVTDMCQRLLEQGAPGLHFYTMNRAVATLAICENLQSLLRGGANPVPYETKTGIIV